MATFIMDKTHSQLVQKINKIKEEITLNSKDISDAAKQGDLSENAEYEAAKERQNMLFYQLRHWESYVSDGITVVNNVDTSKISFGTAVTIKNLNDGEVETLEFVGSVEYELELYPNIMTFSSPLGQALVDKIVGDKVTVDLPMGRTTFVVLNIEELPDAQIKEKRYSRG